MDFNKFSDRLKQALSEAINYATTNQNPTVTTVHMYYGILQEDTIDGLLITLNIM